MVDCCPECWSKLGVGQKLVILQEAKQVHQLNVIANVITEHIRSGDALRAKRRENEGN
jgi:hypothetical protein